MLAKNVQESFYCRLANSLATSNRKKRYTPIENSMQNTWSRFLKKKKKVTTKDRNYKEQGSELKETKDI